MSASDHALDVNQANFDAEVMQASMRQPVLIDFWADWCAPCKQLKPVLEKLAAEYNGAFRLARVDADQEMALTGMFGIRSLPTVVLIKDGQPLDGFMGAHPERNVREFLQRNGIRPQPGSAGVEDAAAAADTPVVKALESPGAALARAQSAVAAQPDNDGLKLDLALAQMRAGQAEAAATTLDALPANLASDTRAQRLRGELELARALAGAPDRAALEQRIAASAKDYAARDLLAVRQLLGGHAQSALEGWLALLRDAREWEGGLAKKRLLAAFALLDDADLVGQARRRMSSLLF
ncbi:tetratricopeptide repeat protein [Metallibacterium sp.]|uniref:tetratricopeptide repeat protein n=1 Tax=Metallibacterium sp. TaxID=2940281 RepID=UPI00260C1F3E|nr:tetratricopeptide repeat protein [Metallibacterium sp.]